MTDNHNDIMALNVLLTYQISKEKQRHILSIICNNFNVNEISYHDLIKCLRVAINCNHSITEQMIWNYLDDDKFNNKRDRIEVNAWFELNGNNMTISNGFESCEFKSVCLVEKLIEISGFTFDKTCALQMGFVDQISKEKHLKSHAEKKALAILLNQTEHCEYIKIYVSMRMCMDCHNFFKLISKCYKRTIECVDPKKQHIFKNGQCLSCDTVPTDSDTFLFLL
eukprot:113889_1